MWCGRLSHGSYRSLWSGKPHAAQGPAVQAVSCGWTGKRRPAHAWRNGYCRMGRSSRRALSSRRRLPLAERLGRYFDFSCTDGGGPWPQEGRMPGMTEICVFLAWIAGGFVSGVSGIGGAMVAFPFLAMLLPVHEAIALTCIVNMVMDICLASLHFRFCRVSPCGPCCWPRCPGPLPGSTSSRSVPAPCCKAPWACSCSITSTGRRPSAPAVPSPIPGRWALWPVSAPACWARPSPSTARPWGPTACAWAGNRACCWARWASSSCCAPP